MRPSPFVWKAREMIVTVLLLIAALLASAAALIAVSAHSLSSGRWLSTAGLMLALEGFLQLDHTGFFTTLAEKYGDETKYPYGPPSYITREIIATLDTSIQKKISRIMMFHPRTGFYLIVCGTILQITATWL